MEMRLSDIIGFAAVLIPLIMFALIINWFFKITPFQQAEGMPLLIAPIFCIVGFILGFLSFKMSGNKLGIAGIICNSIIFLLPFLYIFLGTLFFGP